MQIDLTDDYVVVALFGDGSWEAQVQRVQVSRAGDPACLAQRTLAIDNIAVCHLLCI